MGFDASQILNLVGQLGGNHQQAAQELQGMGQVDPQQHAGLLSKLGIDPGRLGGGGYQQHLDAQQQPGFNGYQQGSDYGNQQPTFGGEQGQGGYDQGGQGEQQGYDQGGQGEQQGYDQGGQESQTF